MATPSEEPTQRTDDARGAGPRTCIVVYHADGVEAVRLAEDRPVVIGRAEPADVIVRDLNLSRLHARFSCADGAVRVEDLESTNGTFVNDERIDTAVIGEGDEARLGGVTVAVHRAAGARTLEVEGHDAFLEQLENEVERARGFDRPLSLVMVRSRRGDPCAISRWLPRLRAVLRPVDHLGMYGPGAALATVPESDRQTTVALIQRAFAGEAAVEHGIAVSPEDGTTAEELLEAAREALRTGGAPAGETTAAGADIVGVSGSMKALFEAVDRVARAAIPVLVVGETGSGKEVVARAIHDRSPRAAGPMVVVHCGAIAPTLLESTLFGHEKGAFTGADRRRLGIFEEASGGTVLLDEVGELSPGAQTALLRVLETKRLSRVGSSDEIEVDVRVIAATHRDLEAMVEEGAFREDLLYRLDAVMLDVPPLRERPADILPLAERFLRLARQETDSAARVIGPEARGLLLAHSWRGNVRELRNVIERAVVLCQQEEIGPNDLSERVRGLDRRGRRRGPTAAADGEDLGLRDRLRRYEEQLILGALEASEWNQRKAAERLQLPLRTLVHKITQLGIRDKLGR